MVELVAGFLFVLAFWQFGFGLSLIFGFTVLSCLLVIFVYDLKHYIIPDGVVFSGIAIVLIFNIRFLISGEFSVFISLILSAIGAAGFFLVIVLVSRGKWMGIGDIKLAFLMGLLLGWPGILLALFLAFSIGAIIGLGLIFLGKKTVKSEVPFGPFLVTGTLASLFLGEAIIEWYLQLALV